MSKLARTPTFGVIVSKDGRMSVRPDCRERTPAERSSPEPVLAAQSKESQRKIVSGLFLTRKKTSELLKVLEEA